MVSQHHLSLSSAAGVRPSNLRDAAPFDAVQREVAVLLKGRIVVGHAIENDLEVRGGCCRGGLPTGKQGDQGQHATEASS